MLSRNPGALAKKGMSLAATPPIVTDLWTGRLWKGRSGGRAAVGSGDAVGESSAISVLPARIISSLFPWEPVALPAACLRACSQVEPSLVVWVLPRGARPRVAGPVAGASVRLAA